MTLRQISAVCASRFSQPGFFLLVILLTAANLRAPITAVGPVLENIRSAFGLSAAAAGFFNFIPLMMFAALAPVAAALGNRYGLERSLWVALLLTTLGSLVRWLPDEAALWSGTFMLSAGIAAANVLLPPLIKRDFTHHTAKYIGLYAATMSLTASLASGVAVPLATWTEAGWRLSLGVWAVPGLVALLAWLPLLTPRAAHRSGATHALSAVGATPWRSGIGWQVSLFMALQSLAFYTLIDWFTPYAQAKGYSQAEAGWLLFLYQAIAILANLGCMVALKRLRDARLTAFVASAAIFCGVLGLLLLPRLAALWLIIAGLGAGASLVLCLSLFNLRARDHRQASQLSGMAQCVGYALAALGPLFFGIVHEQSGDWTLPLTLLAALSFMQMLLAPLAGSARQMQ
ncbi:MULTISPECIES: CynX/NimT family MFS transporter [Pantoea]|jgi:CP family cyanate transporter-like MFS transporter|uniref:CynX/NimT family MFS transporter n=1 Tax=Pantoea TaxID=53335 RepID=UPI000EA1619D|nr:MULTISPECIES: MFS transporter [Pantoea]MBZ6386882.1 MFS transporter [Pantoea piersonii]MBZ6400238.1 MFS transporter [Pantoea piersonii]MBZ6408194.1 MFS transporter [Pantoea piersonii]MBZ6427482.1 MFS transporter [Pantoea piersonii]NYB01598.1 MFS transporter [Pantoea piersonii]